MAKENPNDALSNSISFLEQKRRQEMEDLKQQLRYTGESLKPANLLKSAVSDLTSSPQFKSILIKAAIGLAAGLIAKQLLARHQKSQKNQLINNAITYGVSFLASKRNNFLKAAGIYVANSLMETIRERRLQRRHLKYGEPLPKTAEM